MYTGVEPTTHAKKNLKHFHATLSETFSKKITHVVMNKSKSQLKRTVKLMLALSKSIPNDGPLVVHEGWVADSIRKGEMQDESKYRPNSIPQSAMEKREISETNMFDGYAMYVTKNVKPPPKELKKIITTGGGMFCTLAQMKRQGDDMKKVAITCDQDVSDLKKDASIFVNGIYTNEFVLSGLIQQEFDEKKYRMKGITVVLEKKKKVVASAAASVSSKSSSKNKKAAPKKAAPKKAAPKKAAPSSKKRKSGPAASSKPTRSSKRKR